MFLILFTLKLCGIITWCWWWVVAPLLVLLAIPIFVVGCVFAYLLAVLAFLFGVLCIAVIAGAIGENIDENSKLLKFMNKK